ncbi:MGH1-like glycoside hydrolase domain-containing protein [Maribacter sp. ACAM166]|uniref:MGH1-like glycoside hydrolase domain-containing protein n=1 Tax=Maribacter sp. ACAM166 TaxID=2508996 RepID=UPI001BB1B25F|nr:glycosyl hydrolase family 65 protein [Maribacter sp. ACAM166]
MLKYPKAVAIMCITLSIIACDDRDEVESPVLSFQDYAHYFSQFNEKDDELYKQYVTNAEVIPFLEKNIPLLDIPDSIIQKTYYFRWWTFRKHIKQTPNGFVITEFLPEVPWSGKYNTINCPAAYHIFEGRWLRDDIYIKDYINYWLNEADNVRKYSFWVSNATWAFGKVHNDTAFLKKQFPLLIDNYSAWEKERRDGSNRLFWQNDNMDGMELSSGGRIINNGEEKFSSLAARPTINSYMYADAKAIAELATFFDYSSLTQTYQDKAKQIKELVENRLWNDSLNFFTILPRDYSDKDKPINIRELIGYTPWYFNLPEDDSKYVKAWEKVLDTNAFAAPYGLTTVERSHPYFQIKYEGHECQWNGPSWPFATTQTLKSFSNFLNNYKFNGSLSKNDYFQLLKQYAAAHQITWENGDTQMWIDENINPFSGDWISRTRLKTWENGTWSEEKGGEERGKDYNHSGFCDLVINDLIGFKPQMDGSIVIKPLVPDSWDWFCLDRINYHGKELTIIWDKNGTKYNRGIGFQIIYNGKQIHTSNGIELIKLKI